MAFGKLCFLACAYAWLSCFWVSVIPSLWASAWYQYALIRKSITWLESDWKSCAHSVLSVVGGVFA